MKRHILTLIAATLSLIACNDSLEQYSLGELAQGNLPASDDDAIAMVNAVYQIIYSECSTYLYMVDGVCEQNITGESTSSAGGLLVRLNWDGSNNYIKRMWQFLAEGIAAANDVIDNVEGNNNVSQSIQQRVVGEAKFLRGHYMFSAVRFWGDYPIVLHNSEGSGVKRAPIDDVYTQIVADLSDAAELLPAVSEYSATDLGRATKGAAYAELAIALLTWGQTSEDLTDEERTEKFAQSVAAADNVTGYELEEDILANFDNDNRNGKECVFAFQQNSGIGDDGTGGNHLCHCCFSTGFSESLPHIVPSNRDVIESYEEGDQRKDVSYADSLYNPSTYAYYHFSRPRFRKYIDTDDPEGGAQNRDKNRIWTRYAEVLLIKAEAINERDGQPNDEAYEAINQVRRRAFKSFPVSEESEYDLEAGLDYEGFRAAIEQEREWEFVYEQKRWFDLVRWRKLVKTIKYSTVAVELPDYNKASISLKYYRYPIPQDQRDINPEGLWQNWGWSGYDEAYTGTDPYADYE